MCDDDAWVEELAYEIRTYLRAHPQAADTLGGVVQWWIVHARFLRGVQATSRALDRLVADGEVERIQTADGRTIFRAARERHGKGSVKHRKGDA